MGSSSFLETRGVEIVRATRSGALRPSRFLDRLLGVYLPPLVSLRLPPFVLLLLPLCFPLPPSSVPSLFSLV